MSKYKTISKKFKNQPVEIYVQHDQIYFGFNNKFFQGAVEYETFENEKYLILDIMLTAIHPEITQVPASQVVQLVAESAEYSINSPDYTHKRYVWDSEELVPTNLPFIRVLDFVEIADIFYVCISTNDKIKLLNLEDCTIREVSDVSLRGFKFYQHPTLWKRKAHVTRPKQPKLTEE